MDEGYPLEVLLQNVYNTDSHILIVIHYLT